MSHDALSEALREATDSYERACHDLMTCDVEDTVAAIERCQDSLRLMKRLERFVFIRTVDLEGSRDDFEAVRAQRPSDG